MHFADATVPKVNVVIGKAFGSAYVTMNSKAVGADMVYAWPDAEIGMMDANQAAKIMYADADAATIREKAAEYKNLQSSPLSAAKRGYVDTIIEAADTRKYVIGAFEMLFTKREDRPAKKHGTVREVRQSEEKISVLLCVLVAMLCFTACGSKKENLQYDKSTITQATDFLIEYCNSADADTIEQWNKMTDFQIESQLNQAGVPFTKDSFLAALDAWQQGTKECGEYVSHGDYKFEPSSDELKVTASAKFKDRDADITFVFDEDLYLDSTTIDAHYSIGEIMEKAGLNTILGMGTVFVILIFISILISLFKYIPALEEKFKNKGKAESTQEAAPAPAAVAAPVVEEASNDDELAAVISAAIAAYEAEAGGSTDGFVVRSIKRRPSNKWHA